ncbi:Gag protease polyprotein [Gossypium australe]|uniref:Gag protease polyprotein n=1 Tax=Gossypium australe TaxID=47621 RepID=A0A5B6WQE0_9ROSI|nr:Gag protease polyprotein [Gossypium australe]
MEYQNPSFFLKIFCLTPDFGRKDMLRGYAINFRGSWEEHFPLVEFTYNNSFQLSIRIAPYKALYGDKCRIPLCWTKLGEKKVLCPDLVQETENVVKLVQD